MRHCRWGVSCDSWRTEVFCWKNFEKLWQVFNDPIDEFQSPPVENSVKVVCLSVSKGYRSCSDLGRVKQVKFG